MVRLTFCPKLSFSFLFFKDCGQLYDYDAALYRDLVEHPAEVISVFDVAIREIAISLGAPESMSFELRPFGLKQVIPMRDLNPSDIGTSGKWP
jgi:DNA replicative helicase MCM subunit Mcm2 (Cdc46/Mcm family)